MIKQKGSTKSEAFSWSLFHRKRGAIEFGTKFLIGLILTIIFFLMAYTLLFTDLGPRTVDAANYYVFSKVGIAVSPKSFAKISSAGFLDAKITAEPPSPVCNFETVYFSANSTTLSKGLTLNQTNCYWDFDLLSEPTGGDCSTTADCDPNFYCKTLSGVCSAVSGTCGKNSDCPDGGYVCAGGICKGSSCTADTDCLSDYYCNATKICAATSNDGDPTNDIESTNCYLASFSSSWPVNVLTTGDEKKGIKLTVLEPSGKRSEIVKTITSTLFCACASIKPCSETPDLSPSLRKEFGDGQTVTISLKNSWNFSDMHLILEPVSGIPANLYISVGTDEKADYSFGGNLTNPTVVYGMNLPHAIEKVRTDCRLKSIEPCPVPFTFYFKNFLPFVPSTIRIDEVWIPLSSA